MSVDFFFCDGENCEKVHEEINRIAKKNEELRFYSCGICGVSTCVHHSVSIMSQFPTGKEDMSVRTHFSKPVCNACSKKFIPKLGVYK